MPHVGKCGVFTEEHTSVALIQGPFEFFNKFRPMMEHSEMAHLVKEYPFIERTYSL